MKNLKYIIITSIFVVISAANIILPQRKPLFAGVEGAYLNPIGNLANRWTAIPGASVYFGTQTSDNWIWLGKVEYFKFEKQNSDKLFINRDVTAGANSFNFHIPLSKLNQTLTVIGLSVNAKYSLFKTSSFETNLDLGFGVYNWKYYRSAYDSLTVDTTIAGNNSHILIFGTVPENTQKDWSGGFTLGLEFTYKVFEPVEVTFAANYKNIIGEIWPALTFDLENIATFQMLDIRGGLRISF